MDPNAAWQDLMDLPPFEAASIEERADLAADLVRWVIGGGFLPTNVTRSTLMEHCAAALTIAHDQAAA